MLTRFEIDRINNTSSLSFAEDLWAEGWTTYELASLYRCRESEMSNWMFGRRLRR